MYVFSTYPWALARLDWAGMTTEGQSWYCAAAAKVVASVTSWSTAECPSMAAGATLRVVAHRPLTVPLSIRAAVIHESHCLESE